jgi:hypothetical protein
MLNGINFCDTVPNQLDLYLLRNYTPDVILFFSFVYGKKMLLYRWTYGGHI